KIRDFKEREVLLDAERCSIFIHEPHSETTWLKVGTGLEERDIAVTRRDDTVVGKVIKTGQHLIVQNVDKDSDLQATLSGTTGFVTRNILCIPIRSVVGDKVVGAVQLLNKKGGGEFTEKDVKLVEEMAHYLELTIENIYFNQEVTEVLDSTFNLLENITFVLIMAVIVIGVFLSFGIVGYIISLFG
ncbi:MAG: GAF domain-containing protein, partial [Pseudomonadales bacterium]|nr:GAF domain-containing protein [Pseudomonadales bacterium]